MIYVYVFYMLLTNGTGTVKGTHGEFKTISECQTARTGQIALAESLPGATMISDCGTDQEDPVFHLFLSPVRQGDKS